MTASSISSTSNIANRHGRFLVALAIRRSARLRIDEGMFALLGRHLYNTALVEQKIAAEVSLAPLTEHPGYLKGTINGSSVFVPWHLVEVFPGLKMVGTMEGLSRKIQLNQGGPICLSGSSVFRGAISVVGDIDYCEYLTVSPPAGIPKLIDELISRDSGVFLAHFYEPDATPPTNFVPPWEHCPLEVRSKCEGADQPSDAPRLMFEHIVADDELGILPLTNLVLPVDARNPAADHGQSTFVFQEVVFINGDAPPRTLVSPLELADYVLWLRDQLKPAEAPEANLKGKLNAIKKLKRSLALARLVHLHDSASDALTVLNDPYVEAYVRGVSLAEITSLFERLPDDQKEQLKSRIDQLRASSKPLDNSVRNKIEDDAMRVVTRVAREFDQMADEILRVDV